MPGADWRHPEGPGGTLNGRERHPVLHVAWEDVAAYAAWAGKELPTEAAWEYAARGGHDGWPYAWGQNLALDGYERTAPVGSFPANGYGLLDTIGNVWEWTADWYTGHHKADSPCCGAAVNPLGGSREGSIDPNAAGTDIPRKVLKGGSYACAENYCRRYLPAARMHHPVDTGANYIGFRCVVRVVER